MTPLDRTDRTLAAAVTDRVFPGAIIEVGTSTDVTETRIAGRLTYESSAPAVTADTIYDLASLTKVLCTATLAANAVARGALGLADPVHAWIPEWTGADRAAVTVQHLLEHASGLPAHRPYYLRLADAAAIARAICDEPLDYAPGTRSVYSDAGFILLGRILERVYDGPLDAGFEKWRASHVPGATPLAYCPPAAWHDRIAPTEDDPWRGRLLRGEVHDENAAAMGGVAAHAGLFGTAGAVGQLARWWLRAIARSPVHAAFARRGVVPASSRALGWDTMLPTSSCGTRMSAAAIGHTGFTGTSLWLDPVMDRYVVVLSNRVHPSRVGDAMQRVRPALHDALAADLARS